MKISRTLSTLLSQIATGVAGLLVIVLAALLPRIIHTYYMPLKGSAGTVLALLYGILAFGAAAVVFLWILLDNVRRGTVFTRLPVTCLRVLSWSCVGAGILFLVLGFLSYYFSFIVGAAALFLGLILRVVKNCLEEAVSLKEENDFTI